MLKDMRRVIRRGYYETEDFRKIEQSAVNHVTAIHKIAQKEGYFL